MACFIFATDSVPEAGNAWELDAGEESRASGGGVPLEDDGGEALDDLGAEATSPDKSAPGAAPPAGPAIRGSGVELPLNRVGWDGRRAESWSSRTRCR